MKCKDKSKPFAKIKVILTLEVKNEGQKGLNELMKKMLILELYGTHFDLHLQAQSNSKDPPKSSKTLPPLRIPKIHARANV